MGPRVGIFLSSLNTNDGFYLSYMNTYDGLLYSLLSTGFTKKDRKISWHNIKQQHKQFPEYELFLLFNWNIYVGTFEGFVVLVLLFSLWFYLVGLYFVFSFILSDRSSEEIADLKTQLAALNTEKESK